VLGVFYAHASSLFDILFWHISASQEADLAAFGTRWGMSLFFLLAGASAQFSLRTRTPRQFIDERFMRLIIPFVFGVLLLSPFQGYLLDREMAKFSGSFLQFYPYFFVQIRPGVDPDVLASYGSHLWFLAFLFLFSLSALPFFSFLSKFSGQQLIEKLASLCEQPGGIFVFVLPIALIQLTLRAAFPGYREWADFLCWLAYFVSGYLLLAHQRLMQALHKQGLLIGCMSVICVVALLGTTYGPGYLSLWENTPSYSFKFELYQLLTSITAWSLMLSALWLAMRFLDVRNRFIAYANEAVLPFYVLHYSVIVIMIFLLTRWQGSTGITFLAVLGCSLLGTLALYNFVVKRVNFLRGMFGMKPKRRTIMNRYAR
jgi:glucans biosynthesis protein C